MAPIATELATLRALTFRISSTPTAQLPQHVPAIAASLANCKTLLSSTQDSGTKASSSEASVALHKYRTLLSTLLQDRTSHGRWCAIVLIKASIEVGGWETLQKCLPWVRGLLGFLSKPDPPSSRKLCIITLTRIFILTREYPTLVREITTPSLPAFIQSTLQLANTKAPVALFETILQCYNELLPRHPTMFRSYLKQIQPLLARLVAPTPSCKPEQGQIASGCVSVQSEVSSIAKQLHTQVAHCAAKGASSEDWQKTFKQILEMIQRTADRVLRAVIEDTPTIARTHSVPSGHSMDDEPQDLDSNSLNLPPWTGMYAGSERLVGLLGLLTEYLSMPTSSAIFLNIGIIIDLTTRLLSVTAPISNGQSFQEAVRLNKQIGKEEREILWTVLPTIHSATIKLLLALTARSSGSTLAIDSVIIDQVAWLFRLQQETAEVRTACYLSVADLLQRSGAALSKATVDSLAPVIRACCNDLVPSITSSTQAPSKPGQSKANGKKPVQSSANADTILSSSKPKTGTASGFSGVTDAANNLLPLLLSNIPGHLLSDSLRTRLDRTAILLQHKDAMVSSVLNPPPSKKFGKPAASILPLMARSFPDQNDVEGMLRPRMPVIRLGNNSLDAEDNIDEDIQDEEILEDAEEDVQDLGQETLGTGQIAEAPAMADDDHFAGKELETYLEKAGQDESAAQQVFAADAKVEEPAFRDEAQSTQKPIPIIETTKRAIQDEATTAATKRVKFEDQIDGTSDIALDTSSSTAVGTSTFAATSTASIVPELPQPGGSGADEEDSDMDDIGPLVFGQDSDEESD